MGQCSTLPAEARASSSSVRHDGTFQTQQEQMQHRLREDGRKESLDFNRIVAAQEHSEAKGPLMETETNTYRKNQRLSSKFEVVEDPQPQARDPDVGDPDAEEPVSMDTDSREEAPAPIPPPPEGAVRTRCYKLNLDSEYVGISSSQRHQLCLGPFTEPPPYLTYSSSEDSSLAANPTTVAIQTAQIFRGITVSRDGTILTQNARATRSNRGNKTKKGEKSRQAAKIDKAKDLVEDAVQGVKAKEGEEEVVNMVSLYIVGEYDDMKQLVRDGSKKLREAEGLPDEALVSINRLRPSKEKKESKAASVLMSPRKKESVSPNYVTSQRTAAMQSPDKINPSLPQSAPPKLKSHPRDTRPLRREERAGTRMRLESCHDFMDPRRAGMPGDGDWSHAWNIWNCGGTGTVSPMQPSSPNDGSRIMFEGRDSTFGNREAGVTARAP